MKNTQIQTKKSAIDLTELAIGIVILGVIVSIGARILVTTRDSQLTNIGSYEVGNETALAVTESGTQLSTAWFKDVSTVTYQTNGSVVGSGEYTTTIDGYGKMSIATNGGNANNTGLNVTYNVYNVSDPRFDVPDKAITGLAEYGNWFTILVVIGIASIVLSLIFLSLAGGKNKGGQSF